MSQRKIRYKENKYITPCPECGNNTEFTVISEQVAEDCCEVWAVCKCGHNPGEGFEDVWGGVDDDNCRNAIEAWNDNLS